MASERNALCCTGIPSESSASSVVCHSCVIVASATRVPVLPLPEGPSCAPDVRDPTPVHMVVHRLWVCRVRADGRVAPARRPRPRGILGGSQSAAGPFAPV